MCGIVGYIGKKEALPILLQCLRDLEYRGYDSAGVAVLNKDHIERIREVGKVDFLVKKINGKHLDGNMGIAHTRRLARQLVSHGHITVNGKRITVASHHVKVGDIVAIRLGSQKSPLFSDMVKRLKDYNAPNWLNFDAEKLSGNIIGKPKNTEGYVELNTVLEFYSR